MPELLVPDAESHLIDTNLFIRFERHDTIGLLERAVTEHDIVLLVPQRVYEELTPESYPYDQPPIDDAIESGWVQVLNEVDYSNPVVSATMDMVRQYISVATDPSRAHGRASRCRSGWGSSDTLGRWTHKLGCNLHGRQGRISRDRASTLQTQLREPGSTDQGVRFRGYR